MRFGPYLIYSALYLAAIHPPQSVSGQQHPYDGRMFNRYSINLIRYSSDPESCPFFHEIKANISCPGRVELVEQDQEESGAGGGPDATISCIKDGNDLLCTRRNGVEAGATVVVDCVDNSFVGIGAGILHNIITVKIDPPTDPFQCQDDIEQYGQAVSILAVCSDGQYLSPSDFQCNVMTATSDETDGFFCFTGCIAGGGQCNNDSLLPMTVDATGRCSWDEDDFKVPP